MAKDTFYFKHDYNARNDLKMQAFIHDHKGTGYGIYWVIAEILHEEDTHSLPLKRWVYLAIAKQINEDPDLIETIIKACISEYELFFEKDGCFHSKRVNNNISERSEISAKRSISGKAGANAKQTQANAKQISQERRGKDRKEKKEEYNDNPFFQMFRRAAGKHITDETLIEEVGKFINKYPNAHPNASGALINTWVANIGRTQAPVKTMVM